MVPYYRAERDAEPEYGDHPGFRNLAEGNVSAVFVHRLRVRYSECDQQGQVFNGHYLGTTSMIIHPVFRVDDRLVADGEIRHVFVDAKTLAKTPMPDDVRSAFG